MTLVETLIQERVVPAVKKFAGTHSRLILLCAACVFLVGVAVSIRESGLVLADLGLLALAAIVLIGAPVTVVLNGWGLTLLARFLSLRMPLGEAIATSATATLSNLLPIPGSVFVRGGSLLARGASIRGAGGAVALAALLWLGLASAVTGAALLPVSPVPASIFLFGGVATAGAALAASAKYGGGKLTWLLFLQRALMLGVLVFRIWLGFIAIGSPVAWTDAAVFSFAGVTGAVIAVVPAGLGLSETVAAVLAVLGSLSPTDAFIVVALNRVVGLAVAGLFFVVCSWSMLIGARK